MELNEVGRRLGQILSPVQELYRQARTAGRSQQQARQYAIYNAASLSFSQMQIVHNFIRANALWHIPEEAFSRFKQRWKIRGR